MAGRRSRCRTRRDVAGEALAASEAAPFPLVILADRRTTRPLETPQSLAERMAMAPSVVVDIEWHRNAAAIHCGGASVDHHCINEALPCRRATVAKSRSFACLQPPDCTASAQPLPKDGLHRVIAPAKSSIRFHAAAFPTPRSIETTAQRPTSPKVVKLRPREKAPCPLSAHPSPFASPLFFSLRATLCASHYGLLQTPLPQSQSLEFAILR